MAEIAFRIRVADDTDLPALRELIDASVRGLSVGFYTPLQIESALRFVFGPDTQLLADRTYYVIEAEGELVAAGGWSHRRTLYGGDQHKVADDSELDAAYEPARIRAFFVHPRWARRGLARVLFRECAAAARAGGFRRLELAATLPGEPLYRALGFVALEVIDVPMPDGQILPVIRMARTLDADMPGVLP